MPAYSRRVLRNLAVTLPMLIGATCNFPATVAAETSVGYLLPVPSVDKLGAEGTAAWQLARSSAGASAVIARGDGTFVDLQGKPVKLETFSVLWYHQGDSVAQTGPVYDAKTLASLRKYVEDGGGLYLSGAALAMVRTLNIEPVSPRLGGPGSDASGAALVPVQTKHPVFGGLGSAGQTVPLSDTGHPAFADFHGSGGPSRGMLLARSPSGSENPVVEYELGKGRVIAMGWRLPHYGNAANPHRANLERLTTNIFAYLGDSKQWRKVVITRRPGAQPAKIEPGVPESQWESLELAIADLHETFGPRYPRGEEFLRRLAELRATHDKAAGLAAGDESEDDTEPADTIDLVALDEITKAFGQLKAEALLANPLMDFDRLMLVRRSTGRMGLPTNYQSNSSIPTTGYDNELAVLSPVSPQGTLTTLFRPEGGRFVGDVDLNFDGRRMLFSMPGANGRWQIHEMNVDGSDLRELPLIVEPDVSNYDACYLPDGRVIFTSTAPFVGVPCVRGGSHVTNIYQWDPDGGAVRQLTVDQEHNWCPTVTNSGRVLYLRWEYTDMPHAFYRILFHMNPDGTEQMEYYGSNSYWPNAMFYARPIPGHPTKVVAVVGGHHAPGRTGELIVFDPARGRFEADGAVQRIPGHGQPVEAILVDGLAAGSWPKFLHPYPLSEKHFLVCSQPTRGSQWGLYLVDTFDNFLLLREEPGFAMMEPIPLRPTVAPPAVPDKVDLRRNDATVFMADVYQGGGLRGVPRGTITSLRLLGYHFSYHGMGGQVDRVGLDGPWDVKSIIGTVPVEADGSAHFRVPAYTPISLQPLDAEGKAVQLMRSWFTAMPGEVLSCVGCHDHQNTSPPVRQVATAAVRPPSEIKPWYGPARGFGFTREVQPVLDRHCTSCHNGQVREDGQTLVDLTDRPHINMQAGSGTYNGAAHFSPSYFELRKFVRSPTIESDLHMLPPREFHADTTKLMQILRKGHHGVTLDVESRDRLVTWIDLHTPAHGTWADICGTGRVANQAARRAAMRKLYTGMDDDPEAITTPYATTPSLPRPRVAPRGSDTPTVANWPFDATEAVRRQTAAGEPATLGIDLGEGMKLQLALIPAGQFVMGDNAGYDDEGPAHAARIDRPFWMGQFEITNAQYALFDPGHDSRLEHGDFLQFSSRERGYPVNSPQQPVVRVSQQQAAAFCRWLSEKTGRRFTLPGEAQWEYAARAGTATSHWYGDLDTDFAPAANLSDATHHGEDTLGWGLPSGAIPPWRPADVRFNDKHRVSAPAGSFAANPWGLHDMHGNVAEWTRSSYRSYPYDGADGRNEPSATGKGVVRGGSWYDRPKRARSASRLAYAADQVVFDVGFRVICEVDAERVAKGEDGGRVGSSSAIRSDH